MSSTRTVSVNVLYFGAVADALNIRSESLEIARETTGRTAFDELIKRHAELANRKLLFSVNQRYSKGDEVLQDGDELAVFTAVSGG